MRRAYWAVIHLIADELHLIAWRLKCRAALRLYELELAEESDEADA